MRGRRKQYGEWLPWFKTQQAAGRIKFSYQSARVYMRIANEWARIVKEGWDTLPGGLERLKKRLKENPSLEDLAKPESQHKPSQPPVYIRLILSKGQAAQWEPWLQDLRTHLGTATGDIVYLAIQRLHSEKCRAKLQTRPRVA
jgi:hypothetical protein